MWYKKNDPADEDVTCRMKVHVFATSATRQVAEVATLTE